MSVDELEAGLRWLFAQTYNEEQFNKRKRNYMVIERGAAVMRAWPHGLTASRSTSSAPPIITPFSL